MSLKPPSSRCDPRMVSTAPSAISRSFDASNASDANSSVSASESASDSRRTNYARSLYLDDEVTLDDLREAVTTLEEAGRIGQRWLGGDHPFALSVGKSLRRARDTLRAREAEAVRVAERDATGAMQRDLDALQRRLVLLAAREAGTVQMAEVEALQRDFDALERRFEAREARTVDSD